MSASPGRVAVVGGGSWGTVFACLAAGRGADVTLLCRSADQAAELARTRRNERYLPGLRLPERVRVATLSSVRGLADADLVVAAVPSRSVAAVAAELAPRMAPGAGVLSLTKGLDPADGRRLSEVWTDARGDGGGFCMLSGPNHAEEVAQGQPTAAVVAGDDALAVRVQALLTGEVFRVYTNADLLGVELCAAAKNVVAIAAGMSDGLGYGDNAKASLITRGLAEMTRLGRAAGARAATFRGLAGMGDLVATCTSRHSRNRRAGEMIAGGADPGEVEERLGQVAEGLWTVPRLLERAAGVGVELPICAEVAAAIDGKPVRRCIRDLMGRAPAAEE
ncbi:MAG TPA: NAD(P)H-dependent glycerol-3-phosphate dehydrogenase [Miltoncostaeaceae bacterium]|nr:NAD(P)H-dependent glycerol-3-phosphate dehydrogenase [Miltoncostaeaceae bacterium]